MHKSIALLLVCAWVLAACLPKPGAPPPIAVEPAAAPSATALPQPTSPPPPTSAPQPTSAPEATQTPEPINTPLPAGVLFRDDFNGKLQPGWIWENENKEKWSFTKDGWLQIIGEYDSLLGEKRQNNLLWYPLPEGDFAITVHLKTMPFANFHQSTIYLYEDPDNFIALNRGFCKPCNTGGGGFFMEYRINNNANGYMHATTAEDVYLKLESMNNIISGYTATEPGKWQRIGRFGNFFQFKKVGIGVTNVRSKEDVIGQFDYFEISKP